LLNGNAVSTNKILKSAISEVHEVSYRVWYDILRFHTKSLEKRKKGYYFIKNFRFLPILLKK